MKTYIVMLDAQDLTIDADYYESNDNSYDFYVRHTDPELVASFTKTKTIFVLEEDECAK